MFELPVEIEPFGPGVERRAPLMSDIIVTTAAIAFAQRVAGAPAHRVKDRSRPPMKMGIDDPHEIYPCAGLGSRLVCAAMLTCRSMICQRTACRLEALRCAAPSKKSPASSGSRG